MTTVPITKAQQIVAKSDVNDIVFSERAEVCFALDIKAFDLVEEVAFQKRVHIRLYGMSTGCTLAFAIVQKSFVDQSIADRSNRHAGADIIRKEQDDLTKQCGVCDLFLTSALFPFQNVTNHNCGIDTVEKRQCLFLLQPNISNAGHSTEAHIGIENFAQLVAFTVLVEYLLTKSTESALRFTNLETVEIEELTERERQHFDFHASSGEIGGILRRKKIGIRSGDIDVAVKIHTEGVYRVLPCLDPLQLVKEKIHPLCGDNALFHIAVNIISTHSAEIKGFKIHLDDLFRKNTGIFQVLYHQFQQTGLAAAANASYHLDRLGILEANQLLQINIALF